MADGGDDEGLTGFGVMILLLVLALVFVLILVNIYIVVKWQHPDDKNEWISAKIVVVLGMTIVELVVTGLPLDVSNGSGSLGCSYDWGDDAVCPVLDMKAYWATVFMLALFWMLVAVPICIFAYEAGDEDVSSRQVWCEAVRSEIVMIAVFAVLFGCMFGLLNEFKIPFEQYNADAVNATAKVFNGTSEGILAAMGDIDELETGSTDGSAKLPATFFTYATALTAWVGWFLFSLWGGIGLAALPLDLILSYVHRPIPLGAAEVAEYKLQLQARVAELVAIGKSFRKERTGFPEVSGKMSWWQRRKHEAADRVRLNKLKQMVYILESEIDDFLICSTNRERYEPLVYVGHLILGIIALLHSLLWIIHTIVFLLVDPPAHPFLNDYLLQFDEWYPLFSALACVIFAVYLLFASIKGAFKFGMRFFLIDIHPMKYNGTYMNHMLFNVSLFLLCAFPVAQFTTNAFNLWAQFSDAATVFFVIEHLTFFKIFFANKVFEYILIVSCGLSLIYLIFKPRDEPASAAKLKASLSRYRENASQNPLGTYAPHNML